MRAFHFNPVVEIKTHSSSSQSQCPGGPRLFSRLPHHRTTTNNAQSTITDHPQWSSSSHPPSRTWPLSSGALLFAHPTSLPMQSQTCLRFTSAGKTNVRLLRRQTSIVFRRPRYCYVPRPRTVVALGDSRPPGGPAGGDGIGPAASNQSDNSPNADGLGTDNSNASEYLPPRPSSPSSNGDPSSLSDLSTSDPLPATPPSSPLPIMPVVSSTSSASPPPLSSAAPASSTTASNQTDLTSQQPLPDSAATDRFKVQRRIAVGFIMGAVVIAFVFSPRWVFAMGMLAMSLIGLYEYYRMVAAKGHLPAYKMGLCVTTVTMLLSAFAPGLADVALPVGGTCICIYLLFRRSKIATIADISTTFMGLFYAGYLPSYWVRLHEFTAHTTPDNAVASVVGRLWPGAMFGIQPTITIGSLLVFWTWLAAASADIGAFFFGRTFGRTKFSTISPKKTVEGAIAGFLCSASVSILGAYLLRWPVWWATGAVYGITVGVLGLCGDLFESCFKRDVGWKDSGSLFPGHGGMLDRADSYVLVAPLVYFFATLVLPWITRVVR